MAYCFVLLSKGSPNWPKIASLNKVRHHPIYIAINYYSMVINLWTKII